MRRRIEDYLEAIYDLSKENGVARTTDIAKTLGVKPASVTEMLQKLSKKGFIIYTKYEGVTLTDKGKEIGIEIKRRHDIIVKLLEFLQVPKDVAMRDACVMEHNLSEETIEQLEKFVKFLENCPKGKPEWLKHFKVYSETGKFPEVCENLGTP
ncbi:MAG: metal-dependent transcriptional regulator [Thermoplasmata archaeon]|nr:MAG: metal-dependent transcriptional regulator [Thermoplasmata archaeon]